MDWFRSHHGAPTDPKWRVIAKKAGCRPGDVAAIFWALLDFASQQEDRGSVTGFDTETIAAAFDFEENIIEAVIAAMEAKGLIVDGRLTAWEKRQPKREDDSGSRVRAHRERSVTQRNAPADAVTQGNAPEQSREEQSREDSGASAPAADAAATEPIPLDTKAAIFGEQLAWLKENTGRSERQLRSWLGKCCGQYGEVQVLAAVLNIRAGPSPVDPISRMRTILERQASRDGRSTKKLSPVESLYAGAALALAERQRSLDRGAGDDPPQPLLDGGRRAGGPQAATG